MENTMHILNGHLQEGPRVGLLGWASTSLEPNEDGPAIMSMATPAASKDNGTCKTPNK
jgi:hypothetical protein